MAEAVLPVTRFKVTAEELGWLKLTVAPLPTLNESQFTTARCEVWLMFITKPLWVMLALPATTAPPVGSGDGFVCALTNWVWEVMATKSTNEYFESEPANLLMEKLLNTKTWPKFAMIFAWKFSCERTANWFEIFSNLLTEISLDFLTNFDSNIWKKFWPKIASNFWLKKWVEFELKKLVFFAFDFCVKFTKILELFFAILKVYFWRLKITEKIWNAKFLECNCSLFFTSNCLLKFIYKETNFWTKKFPRSSTLEKMKTTKRLKIFLFKKLNCFFKNELFLLQPFIYMAVRNIPY